LEKDKVRVQDLYLKNYPAVKRLTLEWFNHDNLIIAYDYDNTVFDYHDNDLSFDYMRELLDKCKKIGAKFIVYSCSPKDRHPEMREYLESNGFPVDYINEPHIELADGSGKIFYNILLDDRAGLSSAYLILDTAADIMLLNPKDEDEVCEMISERFGKKEC
jgi:hypothetical protein